MCPSCCLNACCIGQISEHRVLVLELAFQGSCSSTSKAAESLHEVTTYADHFAECLDVLDKSKQEVGKQQRSLMLLHEGGTGQATSAHLLCISGAVL